MLGGKLGSKAPVHPNDHVNRGQSSNDSFPTAMHVAAARQITGRLLPALAHLHQALAAKAEEFKDIIKIGRTHLQDATPVSLGQEFSGYAAQVELAIARIKATLPGLYAEKGGTGGHRPQRHPRFARVCRQDGGAHRPALRLAANKFGRWPQCAMVFSHGALVSLATGPFKIANDIRPLGSGLARDWRIDLPENEPGSSIMPGKVNPTRAGKDQRSAPR